MNLIKIMPTDWDADAFYLMTSVSIESVKKVLQPAYDYAKENDLYLSSEDCIDLLESKYPKAVIQSSLNCSTLKID